MEKIKMDNTDIEKNKKLFEYEMTEVILNLRGEFATVSDCMNKYKESAVDSDKMKVKIEPIRQVDYDIKTVDIPKGVKPVTYELPKLEIEAKQVSIPKFTVQSNPIYLETKVPKIKKFAIPIKIDLYKEKSIYDSGFSVKTEKVKIDKEALKVNSMNINHGFDVMHDSVNILPRNDKQMINLTEIIMPAISGFEMPELDFKGLIHIQKNDDALSLDKKISLSTGIPNIVVKKVLVNGIPETKGPIIARRSSVSLDAIRLSGIEFIKEMSDSIGKVSFKAINKGIERIVISKTEIEKISLPVMKINSISVEKMQCPDISIKTDMSIGFDMETITVKRFSLSDEIKTGRISVPAISAPKIAVDKLVLPETEKKMKIPKWEKTILPGVKKITLKNVALEMPEVDRGINEILGIFQKEYR